MQGDIGMVGYDIINDPSTMNFMVEISVYPGFFYGSFSAVVLCDIANRKL